MKKIALSLVTFLLIQAASFAGVDLGFSTGSTPYDSYMRPVKQVLGTMGAQDPSLDQVNALMRQGHSFRYSFTEPYVAATPETTATLKAGDCKAKALWLADQMDAKNIRFVVGKAHASSKLSHAWLMWEKEGRWYILDCTNGSKAIDADRVSSRDYIPQYSWSKGGTYRHASTSTTLASVANGKQLAVAGNNR